MSTANTSWFHCGRCGSLFQAVAGPTDDRFCTSCGANPSFGIEPAAKTSPLAGQPGAPASPAPVELPEKSSGERKRVKGRKRTHTKLLGKLVIGWCLFLAALIFGVRLIWKEAPKSNRPTTEEAAPAMSESDAALLEKGLPKIHENLFKFLSINTPEGRNQFVLSPIATVGPMARYYDSNPVATIDPTKLSQSAAAVVHLPDRAIIETQWHSPQGHSLDAVFAEENGEWRLDWFHYARFSDVSWNTFLIGTGAGEGEFRVLAREPLADERKGAETISIVLYEPRFGYSSELGRQSPDFVVKRDSPDGRLLEAAFKLERSGKHVYGAELPRIDPKDVIRLRVKVRRETGENGNVFKLEKVVACHWYYLDDPGVTTVDSEKP